MQKYNLRIQLDADQAAQISEGSVVSVENSPLFPEGQSFEVEQKEPLKKDLLSIIIKDFRKLYEAVWLPIKKGAPRTKLFNLAAVYTFLVPSGVSFFLIRGWRFGIVQRMMENNPDQAVAPEIKTLDDVGTYVRDGVALFSAKLVYDIPKIIVLVIIGYNHYELIMDYLFFLFSKVPGLDSFGQFAERAALKWTLSLAAELFFLALTSIIITPAFKISMMKYAKGNINWKGFFSIKELKHSYSLYRKYKIRTLNAYVWDKLVSISSNAIGFALMVFLPFITWLLIPLYKILFKHWPKAYGYGDLARRLQHNGEI